MYKVMLLVFFFLCLTFIFGLLFGRLDVKRRMRVYGGRPDAGVSILQLVALCLTLLIFKLNYSHINMAFGLAVFHVAFRVGSRVVGLTGGIACGKSTVIKEMLLMEPTMVLL